MSSLRSLLERVKLVEPNRENTEDAEPSNDPEISVNLQKYLETKTDNATQNIPPSNNQAPIIEGVSFEEIYAMSGVQNSVFPIEKLIKLLDGLKAMTPEMQKAAISAMDSADDSWTIDDIRSDGNKKIQALHDFKQIKEEEQNAHFIEVENSITSANADNNEIVTNLRTQIADLQLQLDQTVAQTNENVVLLRNSLEDKKSSTQREVSRINEQILTLQKTIEQIV